MTRESQDRYALQGSAMMDNIMQARTSSFEAGFLAPHLKPGLSILDMGCGQGTITVGLAEAVAPGSVLGIDVQAEHIGLARALAEQRGVTNVRFEVSDLFEPPAEPESLDVVYMNAVLSHLSDPDGALTVAQGLLKSGGLVALRDVGGPHVITGDESGAVRRTIDIMHNTIEATSHSPYGSRLGAVMNKLCRTAGLEVLGVTAMFQVNIVGNLPPAIRDTGGPMAGPLGRRAVALGVTTEEELADLLVRAANTMRNDPDAIIAIPWFEVVARKP